MAFRFRGLFAASLLAVLTSFFLFNPVTAIAAEPGIISANEADRAAQSGELVLVDIRRPQEWRDTGVPRSAHAITMHQDPKVFVTQLMAALKRDPTRKLALICATGKRSAYMRRALTEAGFTQVIDVGEGMLGSSHGNGWLKSGLPIKAAAQAKRD